MATIYDVDINQLIERTGDELKKIEAISPPEWSKYAKTGVHKERPPYKQDWWYTRTAAVLRSVYVLGPIGVSKLRQKYGGRKNRGFKPERFRRGSGNIIRKVLQQLEKAGFLRQTEVGNYKGRTITPAGKSFIDKVASSLYVKATPVKEDSKKEKVKAEKPVQEPAKVKVEEPVKPAKEEKPVQVKAKTEKPVQEQVKTEKPVQEQPKNG